MPSKTQSIVIGGLVVGILSTSYLGFINFLCCAGVIVGAAVGAWNYGKTYEMAVPTKDGLLIGIASALLGTLLAAILNYVLALAGIRGDLLISQMVIDAFGDNMPPEQLREMEEQMNRPVSLGLFFNLQLLIGLLITSIFGAIGGAIGGALTRKYGATDPVV